MSIDTIKNEYNFEPVVYYCGIDKDLPPGARCGPVRRDVFLIESCAKGYGTIIINDREFPITPRSCYFLLPGDTVTHLTDKTEPREGYYCALEGVRLENVLRMVGINSKKPFAPSELFDEIHEHLMKLYLTRGESDPGSEMRRLAHIYSILGSLLKNGVQSDSNYWFHKAIGFMETNYHNNISVATLANEVGLERSYFSTVFKDKTGVSPYAYLTSLRIKKAVSLMKEGRLTTGEIASAVGLDPQNFARIFQREQGKSPREYRKELLLEGCAEEK